MTSVSVKGRRGDPGTKGSKGSPGGIGERVSKETAQIIANEPQMDRIRVCVMCYGPAMQCPFSIRAGNADPTVLCSHCATGTRYSLLLQGLVQRGGKGQQSSRLRDIQRAHCPDIVSNQETPGLRRTSWSTAMHTDGIGDILARNIFLFSQGDPGPEGTRGLPGEVGNKGARVSMEQGLVTAKRKGEHWCHPA